MTDKQKEYILSLENTLFNTYNLNIHPSEFILGVNWKERYKNIDYNKTKKCIDYLKLELYDFYDRDNTWKYIDNWSFEKGYL